MKGFTLIELIITTAVLALILNAGIPMMSNMMDNYHANYSLSSLRKVLMNARIIALNSKQETVVCPMQSNVCVKDWSQPLAVFVDNDNDLVLDVDEQLHLKISNEVKRGHWQKKRNKMNFIKFSPLGHSFASATTFLYCPDSGRTDFAKQLVINFQGRIRTNSYLNQAGSPYASISPLSCP